MSLLIFPYYSKATYTIQMISIPSNLKQKRGDSLQWYLLQMQRGTHCIVLISGPQPFRYMLQFIQSEPQKTPLALMKYGSVIQELATLGANWKFYDENFRKLRQSQGTPWDQIHSELWLRSHSFRDKPTNHPKRAKHEDPYIPNGYCWKFHRGIQCPGCSFKHQCFRCGQSHPIAKCQQTK